VPLKTSSIHLHSVTNKHVQTVELLRETYHVMGRDIKKITEDKSSVINREYISNLET